MTSSKSSKSKNNLAVLVDAGVGVDAADVAVVVVGVDANVVVELKVARRNTNFK